MQRARTDRAHRSLVLEPALWDSGPADRGAGGEGRARRSSSSEGEVRTTETRTSRDPPGFVRVDDDRDLLIPERLGNRLTFGFRNILRNGAIGLLFVVPTERETLRVKGRATLHHDPDVVEGMTVRGRPALMYTRVRVQECFFHCGKALIRSHLWQPDSWGDSTRALGARGFASLGGEPDDAAVAATTQRLEQSYCDELY